MTTYTTTGPVRGTCGHEHRSIRTAAECLRRDLDGCRQQGGYSDRSVVRTDGEPLTERELGYADAETDGAVIR
jgi:hypothetical protein